VIRLEAAALLVLIFIFLRLIPRFSSLQNSLQYLANALPALDRVDRVLAEAGAAAEVRGGRGEGEGEGGAAGEAPFLNNHDPMHLRAPLAEGIRVEEVTYTYPSRRDAAADGGAEAATPGMESAATPPPPAPVLHAVSLEIPARRTTALVGVSGSGKTTLVDLLLGLLRPDQGRILVDGTPLGELDLAAWRRGIGYVAQESFLFNDTIRQNLLPDEGADAGATPAARDDALLEALRTARLDTFVEGLPAGLDTVVGERGVRLSGGERQRLALARALVRRPRLLVLDEATSALDYENEALIRQALERLHGETTVVMITHRLPLARSADRIYVLDRGRVVQSGSWEELMMADGRFRELVASGAGEAARALDAPGAPGTPGGTGS